MRTPILTWLIAVLLCCCGSHAQAQGSTADLNSVQTLQACWYGKNVWRFNSCVCGAVGDEAAIRMQNDKDLFLVIDGFSHDDEIQGVDLKRAEVAMLYVTEERGIDPDRVLLRWTRVFGAGATEYRLGLKMHLLRDLDEIPQLEIKPSELR